MILHYHPLASFCWKVLIALYENDIAFETVIVDLGDAESRASFEALWPIANMPVLVDEGQVVPETSIILEYLDQHHRGPIRLIPEDPQLALNARLTDRFYDTYVQTPMQKIVIDRIRPEVKSDPYGVHEARDLLARACRMVNKDMAQRRWAVGDSFGIADCAAFPALYYANEVMPLAADYPHALAYLERLQERPSVARVLREAEPYFKLFPRG